MPKLGFRQVQIFGQHSKSSHETLLKPPETPFKHLNLEIPDNFDHHGQMRTNIYASNKSDQDVNIPP